MAEVEDDHWWYVGLRDLLRRLLAAEKYGVGDGPKVLDAGCGTGATLRLLSEILDPTYLGGFDTSPDALALAQAKAPGADIYCGDIREPEIKVDSLDLITSLDVLYIPGLAASEPGFRKLVNRLRVGGLVILNVPAFDWLRSTHDLALHTSQRFTARELRGFFDRLGLRTELLSYRLFFLFPAVLAARLPQRLVQRPDRAESARSELNWQLPRALNSALLAVQQAENRLISKGARLPWGTSVFAVGRKTGSGAGASS